MSSARLASGRGDGRRIRRRARTPDRTEPLDRAQIEALLTCQKLPLRERTLFRLLYESAARGRLAPCSRAWPQTTPSVGDVGALTFRRQHLPGVTVIAMRGSWTWRPPARRRSSSVSPAGRAMRSSST
ncbi:hypothetical protein ACIBI9_64880 [Nonomuraea sp. NPDC050451]|uniref:hypothetical protein n=1 Tax=Nonomuraea sp. NPDC050451 TaxID=3364364 RepID=UPI0037945CCB